MWRILGVNGPKMAHFSQNLGAIFIDFAPQKTRLSAYGMGNFANKQTKFLAAPPHFCGTLAKMAGAPYFVAHCAHVRGEES